MKSIDHEQFSQAILRQYPGLTASIAEGYANLWSVRIDPMLYDALECWMNQKPMPDVRSGEMTLSRILSIRGDRDELQAILLLSDYIRNPVAGMARILTPIR